jgi:hypothetical protein
MTPGLHTAFNREYSCLSEDGDDKGPAQRGDYADRSLDCQQALESMFLELVRTAYTPYLDLSNMAGPIFFGGLGRIDIQDSQIS